MEDVFKMLPGGPSAIHIYGKYIFPPVNDMSTLERAAAEGLFPTFASIFYPALFYAVVFGILRAFLTKLFFRRLAIFSRGLHDLPAVAADPVIEKQLVQAAIARAKADRKRAKETKEVKEAKAPGSRKIDDTRPTSLEVKKFCLESPGKYDEARVFEYLRERRRFKATEMKITKFVEAFWRFLFYFIFVILGYFALFRSPGGKVAWIDVTRAYWDPWPFIKPEEQLPALLKLYYQLELGCYLHQLYWTEVDRKDATEMIIHHCSTILLILWSWCCNFTRIGTVILLVHDVADIFLESAKCFVYASGAKGGKWLNPVCDVLFGIFALLFAASRLYYYPRYCVSSLLFESVDVYKSREWLGYWFFSSLLCILQLLHVFWFYLILKMVWGLIKKGKVEADVRSDDEDDDEAAVAVATAAAAEEKAKSKAAQMDSAPQSNTNTSPEISELLGNFPRAAAADHHKSS